MEQELQKTSPFLGGVFNSLFANGTWNRIDKYPVISIDSATTIQDRPSVSPKFSEAPPSATCAHITMPASMSFRWVLNITKQHRHQ